MFDNLKHLCNKYVKKKTLRNQEESKYLAHVNEIFYCPEYPILIWGSNLAALATCTFNFFFFFLSYPFSQPSCLKHELFLFCYQYLYPNSLEQIRLPSCQLLYPTQSLSCHPQSHEPQDMCQGEIARQ